MKTQGISVDRARSLSHRSRFVHVVPALLKKVEICDIAYEVYR